MDLFRKGLGADLRVLAVAVAVPATYAIAFVIGISGSVVPSGMG